MQSKHLAGLHVQHRMPNGRASCSSPRSTDSEVHGSISRQLPSQMLTMTTLLSNSSSGQLAALADTLDKGEDSLGQMWTEDLQAKHKQDLSDCQQLLPGATGIFRAATPQEKARRPSMVDPELLDGTSIDFRRSLVRLAYILQHAATLHPMAGDLQATLNSETAGISNIHSWGLMLPSSSRVSPVTYHAVVAVRYPGLCRLVNGRWELGSFASGGIPTRPPGFQMVLWDTDPKITGLVAADLEAIDCRRNHPRVCRQRRVCRWPLCHDYCHRPQEQP